MMIKRKNTFKFRSDQNTSKFQDFISMPISLDSIKSHSVFTRAISLSDSTFNESLIPYDIHLQNSINEYLNIDKIESDFDLITDKFEESIYEAIEKSKNCMIPCFNVACDKSIQPNGSFAVIDIGGSTLRVSVVKFLENNKANCLVNNSWTIEDGNKHLDRSFFKWIAKNFKSIIHKDLISELTNEKGYIKLGITWSFPIIQNESSNRGIVSDLGKGFSISDEFRGKDLKDIFEDCFQDNDIPIEIYAIVNDSTSVFVTGSYFNNSKLGLVQGTGINSSFLIEPSLLGNEKKKLLPSVMNDGSKLLINSESSFLGYHLNDYICSADRRMNMIWDLMSYDDITPPHLTTDAYGVFQPLEIITSGRYIPEIIRRIFVGILESDDDVVITESNEYSLTAEFLAGLSECSDLSKFRNELEELIGVENIKLEDLNTLKIITETVIYRASIILSSYIIALVRVTKFTHLENLEISVVGSMLQYFPDYKETVLDILEVESQDGKLPIISFDFIKDSSIYGASIAAFVNESKTMLYN
ncbi:hypothetical protein C6P40_003125 [Pichia californica]|uniref:Phosphotransferase n=1 Tax=Pichia californica TaxID=460514 RepID=A0A9P6WIW9_9ASCO|nr:hypothetical protein C6P42_003228 [[Candida] californica]KAG0686947.1 hypothetical protein C6P40_003125 [[Candida] californica]